MTITLNEDGVASAVAELIEQTYDDGRDLYPLSGYATYAREVEAFYYEVQSIMWNRGSGSVFTGVPSNLVRIYAIDADDESAVIIGIAHENSYRMIATLSVETRDLGKPDDAVSYLRGIARELDLLEGEA